MVSTGELKAALENALGVGEIDGGDLINSYGFNSLMFVEVICDLEEKFDVDIELSSLQEIGDQTTVDELVELLMNVINS